MPDYTNERPVCNFPWTVKRLILWLSVHFLLTLVIGALLGLLLTFLALSLTMQEMNLTISTCALLLLSPISYIFMRWKWRKAGHSLKTIWGERDTRIWLIIASAIFGILYSLVWANIVPNVADRYTHPIFFFSQFALMGFVAPFIEELFFRGLLYRVLQNRYAVLFSAIVFTVYHVHYLLQPAHLVLVFGCGVVTAILVERTNSLTASFSFHVGVNSVNVIAFQFL